jgi:hypothetical protein
MTLDRLERWLRYLFLRPPKWWTEDDEQAYIRWRDTCTDSEAYGFLWGRPLSCAPQQRAHIKEILKQEP